MRKKSPDEERRLARVHVEPSQTVASMGKTPLEEISIPRQKCGLLEPEQAGHDIIVVHSLAAEVA